MKRTGVCGRQADRVQRSPDLAPLSREHHVALEHALRLRRTTEDRVAEDAARFLAFFVAEGEGHFLAEEELLLPVIPGAHADAARRLVDEHAEIRRRAQDLGTHPGTTAAHALGKALARHVRFEERELFPVLERVVPAEQLAEIGRRLTE